MNIVTLEIFLTCGTRFTRFSQSWEILENPGKKWSRESYRNVIEKSKNSEFHGNLFARKKGHGKVMEISCPNPPNRVPFVLYQCGSRLYSSVSLITLRRL